MPNETTTNHPTGNPYRAVLEDLAKSRGLSGAEELAEKAAAADPDYTPREILDGSFGGFGPALDEVLDLDDKERMRIVAAHLEASDDLARCSTPGCDRPRAGGRNISCAQHRTFYAAHSDYEAWGLARKILAPWVESSRHIGHGELTWAMEKALEEVDAQRARALEEAERTKAAL